MDHSFNIDIAKKVGIAGAVILNNIYWWVDKNSKNQINFFEGKYWTYNKKSVSRETNYFNKNLHFCIRAYSKLIDNFDKRGKTDFRDFFIAYTIIYTYFRMMKKDWINIDNSNEHIIIEEFRTFFKTYQHYYQNIKPEVFSKAYEKIKTMYNGKEPNGGKQNFIIWLVNIMK